MANGINTMAYNIRSMTKAGKIENAKLQQDFAQGAAAEYGTTGLSGQQGSLAREEAKLQEIYIRNKGKMSELEKSILESRIAELKISKQQLNNEIEQNKSLEKKAQTQQKLSQKQMGVNALKSRQGYNTNFVNKAIKRNRYLLGGTIVAGKDGTSFVRPDELQQDEIYRGLKNSASAEQINVAFEFGDEDTFSALREGSTASIEKQSKALEELESRLKSLGVTKDTVDAQMQDEVGEKLVSDYQKLAQAVDASEQAIKEYNQAVATGAPNQDALKQNVQTTIQAVRKAEENLHKHTAAMRSDAESAALLTGATRESVDATINLGTASGTTKKQIMDLVQQYEYTGQKAEISARKVSDFGGIVTNLAQGISGISMAFTSLLGVFDVLNNDDMTFWEKLLSITSTLGMTIPMIVMGVQSLTAIEWKNTIGKGLNA